MREATAKTTHSTHLNKDQNPFGVYVHWPFCKAKCPYCDFNSHVRAGGVDQREFVKNYLAELEYTRGLTGAKSVSSVFFGGGTPSLMDVETVDVILNTIDALWGIEQGAEITLEANPTSVEADKFKGFQQSGVNRVSLGVQSLRDSALKWLGRQHTSDEALKAVALARHTFDRVSFDLIYARPEQSLDDWRQELVQALSFSPDHLSLYQLTIEEGTAFHKLWEKGSLLEISDDIAREQYDLTQEITQSAGLPAYEISNHARLGEESRHNLIYWRGHDYAGIGPGAHGRISIKGVRTSTATKKNPEGWASLVGRKQTGFVETIALTKNDIADERLIMGLRLREGLSLGEFSSRTGYEIDLEKLQHLFDLKFLKIDAQGHLCVMPQGRPVLNTLIQEVSMACDIQKK